MRGVATNIIIVFALLISIIWIQQSSKIVNLVINNGISIYEFLKLSVLVLPSLSYIILPIAMVLAIVYYLKKLSNDKEIIGLKTLGFSHWGIVKPIALVAFIVTLLHCLISGYLLPASQHRFKSLNNHLKNNYFSVLITEETFATKIKGLTIFAKKKATHNHIEGVFIHDARHKEKTQTITAKNGNISYKDNGAPIITLTDGILQQFDKSGNKLSLLSFAQYSVDLSPQIESISTRYKTQDERYIWELLKPGAPAKFLLHAHQRILWPLYSFILTLLVSSIILNNLGKGHLIRLCLLLSGIALSVIVFLYLSGLRGNYKLAASLMYGETLLLFALGIYSLRWHAQE